MSKAAKKTASKADKPFDTKAPKGKCHVHIVVAVPSNGDAGVYHATPRSNVWYASNEAIMNMGGRNDTLAEVYHVMLELPAGKQKSLAKAKPKKVTKLENPAAVRAAKEKEATAKAAEKEKAKKASQATIAAAMHG